MELGCVGFPLPLASHNMDTNVGVHAHGTKTAGLVTLGFPAGGSHPYTEGVGDCRGHKSHDVVFPQGLIQPGGLPTGPFRVKRVNKCVKLAPEGLSHDRNVSVYT